ncbi:MAG TPA: metallophosphoesterase [Pseudomonadales bacterium]
MPTRLECATALAALLILGGCRPDLSDPTAERPVIEAVAAGERSVPWTSLEPSDHPNDFHFVVVTDRTGQHRPGVFADAMPKVNLLAPAFVVSVGDLIEGYTDDQSTLDSQWDEFEDLIARLDAPFFYTPGNHDMSNAVMAQNWQRRFGPSYYHFVYKDVLFVVLNSELFGMVGQEDVPVPGPWTQQDQMAFVERVLAEKADVRWTIVLLHQPLWDMEPIDDDWLRVEALLGERNYTVFAGHYHRYSKQRRHDRNFITLATTGGGSGLRGPLFGEFDHVAWVTMTDQGPRIANLLLDGIHDDDVSNPKLQAEAEALTRSIRVRAEPDDQPTFESTTQVAVLSNPGTADLHVVPALVRAGNFTLTGLEPRTVAPGATVELPLALRSEQPIAYRDLDPAAISWTLSTDVQGRPTEVQLLTPLLPLTVHPIPVTEEAPAIDGDLSDWGDLTFEVDRQGDVASAPAAPEDVSFRFDVREDAESLYVAVAVRDDSLVSDPSRIARAQDAVMVAVDTRESVARNRSMEVGQAVLDGDMAQTAMLMLTPEPAAPDRLLGFLAQTARRTRSVTVRAADGYRAEVAFPHALLDEKAGRAPWREARIAVAVYDFDDGESGNVVLHWQPYRYGQAPLEGTHAFTRAAGRRD